MKTIKIIKSTDKLLVQYMPTLNFNGVIENINQGKRIKNTFYVDESNLVDINSKNHSIVFSVAELKNGYYCLNQEVFNISNLIYIEKDLNINDKWFITYSNVSIFKQISRIISSDLFIVKLCDGIDCHIPESDFLTLIESFPNYYEIGRYIDSRIAGLLSNYVEGVWKYKDSYDKYIEKKEKYKYRVKTNNIKLVGYDMYKEALDTLSKMLDNPELYTEKIWQERIYEVVCVLYPKYIVKFREVEIGGDGRHNKNPDFLLVDSSGFVDIMEIKKPDNQKIMSSSEYRNNYIAGRDLEGAIVQIEKYIYILNHEGEARTKKIQEQIKDGLPKRMEIKVVNPQGILLLGRSEGLTDDQLYDFEIIKRQHKNIIDIMTYDDLLDRLNNILSQMKVDIDKRS